MQSLADLIFVGGAPGVGVETLVRYNGNVPIGSTPKNGNDTFQVIYSVNGKNVQVPSTWPAMPGAVYKGMIIKEVLTTDQVVAIQQTNIKEVLDEKPSVISEGGIYVTGSGSQTQVDAGVAVPASWTEITPVVESGTPLLVDSSIFVSPLQGAYIAANEDLGILAFQTVGEGGGFYQNPTGGIIVEATEGQVIPDSWINVTALTTQEQQTTATTYVGQTVEEMQAVIAANSGSGGATPIVTTAIQILAIAGVGVIGYIGYLFIFKPAELRKYTENLSQIKDLAVSAVYITGAVALLAALSFVGYKFSEAYEREKSVGGAIGVLIAEFVVFSVDLFVTTFKELALGLWEWFKSEIQDLLSGGLIGL